MDLSYTTENHLHPIARTGENVSLWPILHSLLISRERENKLPLLTPEEAVRLFEEYRRGDFARIQLFWDAMEERDEDMCAVIAARIGGIEDLPPRIEADADAVAADPTLATLAEQQAAHLRTRLAAVANLQEAIAHLAMSDFRGVAALEICGTPTLQRWEVIEPWCLIRPARRGPWLYNPTATPGAVTGEALDPACVIIAEARALDLPAMFLLCAKYHSTSGWDAFLDVFGNPSLFLELPPQTTPQMAQEYDAIVRQIIGEGRGTIPSGSKFQTVETGQNSADSFAARAEWCKKALITLALGGTLTMMSESGTGTLAGSAHTDSLTRLITATARRISRAVDTQWAAPILRTAFPGKPILAHFTLRAEEERDTAAAAQLLATLAGAGYTVTEAQAEELLGFPVTYHAPAAPQPFSNTDPEPPTDPTDPAPLTNTTDPAPAPAEAEAEAEEDAPLTEAELTALRSLTSAPLSPASLTPALSSALTSALTNRGSGKHSRKNKEKQSAPTPVSECRTNPLTCVNHSPQAKKKQKLGKFPKLARIIGDKEVTMGKWISMKGKGKHRIKNPEKLARSILDNPDFIAPYDENIVNVYHSYTNTEGKVKYAKLGIDKNKAEVTTVFIISQAAYETAKEKAL